LGSAGGQIADLLPADRDYALGEVELLEFVVPPGADEPSL